MARILIVASGTLGTIHPYIAIGRELVARGHTVIFAAADSEGAHVTAAGLEFHPLGRTYGELATAAGMSEVEWMKLLAGRPLEYVKLTSIEPLARRLQALELLAGRVDCVVSVYYRLSSALFAEKHGLPYVEGVSFPMGLLSPHKPSLGFNLQGLQLHPDTAAEVASNRRMIDSLFEYYAAQFNPEINRLRAEYGLAPQSHAPVIERHPYAAKIIALYSKHLAPLPPDAPPEVVQCGFTFYDGLPDNRPESLDPEVEAFLQDGAPPITITLGSAIPDAMGDFYEAAVPAARKLGRRVLMLVGPNGENRRGADWMTAQYVPHSLVFARSCAILHHGGSGSTAQAMRAGKPQIVAPFMGDQFDNARLLVERGLGIRIIPARFGSDLSLARIDEMLKDAAIVARARELAPVMQRENGAARAADAILSVLD